jgi:hypothetical protein
MLPLMYISGRCFSAAGDGTKIRNYEANFSSRKGTISSALPAYRCLTLRNSCIVSRVNLHNLAVVLLIVTITSNQSLFWESWSDW